MFKGGSEGLSPPPPPVCVCYQEMYFVTFIDRKQNNMDVVHIHNVKGGLVICQLQPVNKWNQRKKGDNKKEKIYK